MRAYPLLILAFVCGPVMVIEGMLIVVIRRQIVPMPKRILDWIGLLVPGIRSITRTAEEPEPIQGLRTYGYAALVFGVLMLVAAAVNVVWMAR